jgi:uncharacterized protein
MSKFIWHDLMTPDVAASSAFYTHVIGWSAADSGVPGMDYTVLSAGPAMVAGMMAPPPSAPNMHPAWNVHIYADDVDATAKRAVALGGSIIQDGTDIGGGVGRFAVVADPSGAPFTLFAPGSNDAPAEVADNTPGHVGWHELISGDWEQAWAFYSALFGWTIDSKFDMGKMGTYLLFASDGKRVGGMMTKPDNDPSPPHWNNYFNVDSAAAATKRATDKGATLFFGPMQVPTGGWISMLADPQGAGFCVLSVNP